MKINQEQVNEERVLREWHPSEKRRMIDSGYDPSKFEDFLECRSPLIKWMRGGEYYEVTVDKNDFEQKGIIRVINNDAFWIRISPDRSVPTAADSTEVENFQVSTDAPIGILIAISKQGPYTLMDGNHRAVVIYRRMRETCEVLTVPMYLCILPNNSRMCPWF
ncbi:MAG: hypothetical protein Sv326_0507 [Candidatus Fermentimicrarchaeum limneticum]|uniref:Uncharacterized protein n=1 Tax=Fermentimicrarchaeum limneticum TaxID=2795018 RepID=A0A7D6BNM2_FERL1|nr:MAG: hypothetical protein Sv326_0507 [Candidatus Fermentimicrarchaeum limneticum]